MPTRRSTAVLLIVALLLAAGALGLHFAFATPTQITDWNMGDVRPMDRAPADGPLADVGVVDRSEVTELSGEDSEAATGEADARSRILRGRVVDIGGTPVAGAEVRLSLHAGGRSINRGEVDRPIRTARDGVFAFRGPLGSVRSVAVAVTHPAHAPALVEREITGQSGEIVLDDVILTSGGVIVGTVTTTDGVGIVDALAELSPNQGPSRGVPRHNVGVRTVGGGSYRIERVPPGTYRLHARAPRMLAASSQTFAVREGDTTTIPPLALGPGCQLDGLVTDRQGQPVAGARIWVNPDRPGPVATGESAADGRFAIDNLARATAALRVQREGYVSYHGRLDLAASERATVVLEAGLRITGTVRDAESGQPLTTFAVQARRLRALTSRSVETGLGAPPLDPSAGQELAAKISRLHETRRNTALDQWRERVQALPKDPGPPGAHPGGEFVCDGLDEGIWVVDVSAPEHQLARSATLELVVGRPATVDFVLARGHTVTGTALGPDGAGIAGALAELMLMPPPDVPASARTRGVSVQRTTTSPTGEFVLRNAPTGWVSVAVSAKGHDAAQSAPFELAADVDAIEIHLGARASIVGRALGAPDGGGETVSVVAIANFRNVTSRTAQADGTFVLDDLKAGPYHLRAYLCDGREATRRALASLRSERGETPPDLVLVAGETRTFDVAVQRIQVGRVTGTARRNGTPAHGYVIRLTRLASEPPQKDSRALAWDSYEGPPLQGPAIEADGGFAIPDVEAGDYWLQLRAPGRDAADLHRERITVAADQTAHVVIAVVSGSIEGEVVAPEPGAAPLAGRLRLYRDATTVPTDVNAWDADGRVRHARFAAGRFRIEDLPAGSYLVEILAGRDRANATARIEVAPGDATIPRMTAGAKVELPPKQR